jgi:hypothetical protein
MLSVTSADLHFDFNDYDLSNLGLAQMTNTTTGVIVTSRFRLTVCLRQCYKAAFDRAVCNTRQRPFRYVILLHSVCTESPMDKLRKATSRILDMLHHADHSVFHHVPSFKRQQREQTRSSSRNRQYWHSADDVDHSAAKRSPGSYAQREEPKFRQFKEDRAHRCLFGFRA